MANASLKFQDENENIIEFSYNPNLGEIMVDIGADYPAWAIITEENFDALVRYIKTEKEKLK